MKQEVVRQLMRALGCFNQIYRSPGTPLQAGATGPPASVSTFAPERVIRRPMPPITRTRAVSAKAANRRLKPDELVLGVVVRDQARAYPINVLTGPDREGRAMRAFVVGEARQQVVTAVAAVLPYGQSCS